MALMLKSVDTLRRAVSGPLAERCGSEARMLTAELHGKEVRGLAFCPGRVVRFVLDDDVNTFQHVVDCLRKIIPGMSEEKAWGLANRIDGQGSAEVWCGPLEQAELYHQQLAAEGLTMAPLERC